MESSGFCSHGGKVGKSEKKVWRIRRKLEPLLDWIPKKSPKKRRGREVGTALAQIMAKQSRERYLGVTNQHVSREVRTKARDMHEQAGFPSMWSFYNRRRSGTFALSRCCRLTRQNVIPFLDYHSRSCCDVLTGPKSSRELSVISSQLPKVLIFFSCSRFHAK